MKGEGMTKIVRASVILVLCLTVVGPCFADSLLVTWSTNFDLVFANNTAGAETVSGSFAWDTTTQLFSNIAISSTGPVTLLPVIQYVVFAGPDDPFHRPVGSILVLSFPDTSGTSGLTLDYRQHAGLDTPLEPFPGSYAAFGEFWLGGLVPSRDGSVVATAVATPEPSSLALMLSVVGLVFAMRKRWGLSPAS